MPTTTPAAPQPAAGMAKAAGGMILAYNPVGFDLHQTVIVLLTDTGLPNTLISGIGGDALAACYAEAASSIGSMMNGSSFSGLLTRGEIGHIRIGSAANGRIRSLGSGSSPSQRT